MMVHPANEYLPMPSTLFANGTGCVKSTEGVLVYEPEESRAWSFLLPALGVQRGDSYDQEQTRRYRTTR